MRIQLSSQGILHEIFNLNNERHTVKYQSITLKRIKRQKMANKDALGKPQKKSSSTSGRATKRGGG